MKITNIFEAGEVSAAFAFGRFNPAHQGHIEVWRTVEDAGANWYIGTNPTTVGPNDPLSFEQKKAWMEEIYPPISGHIVPEQSVVTLAARIFKELGNDENASIAYITDATDWAWSGKLLNQYNGKEGAHGYYKFAQIVHVPSPRVSSATALRDAARANDKVAFYHASGTDPKAKVAGKTYFDTVKEACAKYPVPVKRGQKVKEQGMEEGVMSTIANKVMGAAPEQPKYKVGQRVKYETSPHQPDWKDGGRGVGVITAYKNGHYMINGNPVNHFEIKGVVDQGVAEGAGFDKWADDRAASQLHKLKPATTWEVSYDYGPHMSKSVTVKASSEQEARVKVEKAAEKRGLDIMINSVTPASQVNEFAPDGFNGGDDDEGFSPEIAKMAQEDGFTKGVSLADGATLERAITINYWHSQHGGMYKQYFAKGFKAGRMNKISHDNRQYNLNLQLMKDGSIRHGELNEYGDTAKGQKMLGKVHNRAADKVTSKQADKDPAYARKAQQTQDRAWDRLAVKEQGVAEGAPIVVMPRADRLKKPEPTKVRYQGDIVPDTKPSSTEKRGVKGRPGQRPMPTSEAEGDAKGVPHVTKELLQHIIQQAGTEGAQAIIKSLEWGDGAAKELLQLILKDLQNNVSMAESVKQRLDPSCWKGKHKEGTKIKGGVRVNNCVANEASLSTMRDFFAGDAKANDPLEITKQRLYYDPKAVANKRKEFRSQFEYDQWLKKHNLKSVSGNLKEDEATLRVGDPVEITGDVRFKGATGEVEHVGQGRAFLVVNLYNFGKRSFHSSDVSYNDYVDSDEEEARAYDTDPDARNWQHESVDETANPVLSTEKAKKVSPILGSKPKKHPFNGRLVGEDLDRLKARMDEVSNSLLGRYKKAAGADASKADKEGDFEKGNKRFKGIVKATNKEFDNDMKKNKGTEK